MWFKSAASAASSVWSVTKSLLGDSRSPAQKLLDDITESEDEIISTNKLNDLSTMTYEIDTFNEIVTLCLQRLKVFRYDLDEARKNLNVLITVNYLIKHGATGFVDELREHVGMFERYQGLKELHTYESADLQEKLNYEL